MKNTRKNLGIWLYVKWNMFGTLNLVKTFVIGYPFLWLHHLIHHLVKKFENSYKTTVYNRDFTFY